MDSERPFRIAYLPLTKANWSNGTLEGFRRDTRRFLESLPGVRVLGGEAMVSTEAEALACLERMEVEQPDLVVAHFLTFALGTIVPGFARALRKPVLLWSMPEPDPAGGRLRSNSFCAANMNSHFLYRMHVPYFHLHAEPGAPEAERGLERAIRTTGAVRDIGRMRIGLVGGRVPGFYTSSFDEMLLRNRIGAEVKYITEHELIETARGLDEAEVAAARRTISGDASLHPTDAPEEDQLRRSAALFAAAVRMKEKHLVDALAIRCWPEFIDDRLYGIAVCSTIGHLTNHGIVTACEGDVYGAVLMRLARRLSGELPFFCDLIVLEGDSAVAWHCGAAPARLCKAGETPCLCHSATVEGGGVKGVTIEFPLRPGRVTIARLGETRDGDSFRMLIAGGEALDTGRFVRGNPLRIRFDAGCERVRDTIIAQGWEHHYVVAYGDLTAELQDVCRLLDIEATVLQ